MNRLIVVLVGLMCPVFCAAMEKKVLPYELAREHEIKPHRRTIPMAGVRGVFNQLRLTLTVSENGDVIESRASGDDSTLKFWTQLQGEVNAWKFVPFEIDGRRVKAEVEEYLDIVPPERLPQTQMTPPVMRPNSKVVITLARSSCFGTCPSYSVSVTTQEMVFEGHGYVVAGGKHMEKAKADEVLKLAQRFVDSDFYSMDEEYVAPVTDNPSYTLSLEIDGRSKRVLDYVGQEVGMPAVISDLEEEVDLFAGTARWIKGGEGLIQALKAENFNFHSFDAQTMLKECATRGLSRMIEALLDEGVPLDKLPFPKALPSGTEAPFAKVGWLNAASRDFDSLRILMKAGASKNDQADKDLALVGAARSGNLGSVRSLIDYGANPNSDLSKLTITEAGGGMTMEGPGSGSILFYAAESGKPELVREILRYHPKLEAKGPEGKTALFAASEYSGSDDDDDLRVECVRILVKAGANVNARDSDGNTPLHETFLTSVEEELLRLGADVNARNKDGETPIFTTVDDEAMALFIEHGADLSIRNKEGETALDAAKGRGPLREKALRDAIQNAKRK